MLFCMPNIQGSRITNNMLTLSKAIPHPVGREVGLYDRSFSDKNMKQKHEIFAILQ